MMYLLGYKPSKVAFGAPAAAEAEPCCDRVQFETQSVLQLEKADPRGLSHAQFVRAMTTRMKRQDPDEVVRQTYKAFDLNCELACVFAARLPHSLSIADRGYLTVDDLKAVFKEAASTFILAFRRF